MPLQSGEHHSHASSTSGRGCVKLKSSFSFIWTWNDPLIALDFAPGSSAPLNVYNRSLMRESGTNIVLIAPGRFISMIIPVVVFFVFQRYFVEGLLAGSIK